MATQGSQTTAARTCSTSALPQCAGAGHAMLPIGVLVDDSATTLITALHGGRSATSCSYTHVATMHERSA